MFVVCWGEISIIKYSMSFIAFNSLPLSYKCTKYCQHILLEVLFAKMGLSEANIIVQTAFKAAFGKETGLILPIDQKLEDRKALTLNLPFLAPRKTITFDVCI